MNTNEGIGLKYYIETSVDLPDKFKIYLNSIENETTKKFHIGMYLKIKRHSIEKNKSELDIAKSLLEIHKKRMKFFKRLSLMNYFVLISIILKFLLIGYYNLFTKILDILTLLLVAYNHYMSTKRKEKDTLYLNELLKINNFFAKNNE